MILAAMPSMGPLFFRAENVVVALIKRLDHLPSMGPLFFRAENPRNSGWQRRHRVRPSMGPLFFRVENLAWLFAATVFRVSPFNGAALFQSGEPRNRKRGNPGHYPFNGAALFQSGEPRLRPREPPPSGTPSMGPLFFRAENSQTRHSHQCPEAAPSMGPLFFRAENPKTRPRPRRQTRLQWGRSFSERRTT